MPNYNHREATALSHQLLNKSVDILLLSLPILKNNVVQIVEYLFIPKAMARQLILAILLEMGVKTVHQLWNFLKLMYTRSIAASSSSSKVKAITQFEQITNCASQEEWMDLCKQMDAIEGNDVWRSNPNSCWYEQTRITNRIQELQQTKSSLVKLMASLQSNGGIVRNSYGLLHENLYTQAMAGTKVLIDQYHSTLCAALNTVCDAEDDTVDINTRLA